MRWIAVALVCAVLSTTCAEPEPKKYHSEVKTKEKQSSTLLTDEERKFLREVEAKFGIKSDVPAEPIIKLGKDDDNDDEEEKPKPTEETETSTKPPFPAIIAIEIVNDTDTKSKGKRTIDANLGYGYRTNNGYTYTYFGKKAEEKGKFMIYPYSQHDIPPANPKGQSHQSNSAEVEITPSQAYELVPAKEEQQAYHYEKPAVEFKTKYENPQTANSPPPQYPESSGNPSILYTTYNGQQFSGLSGKFPSVKPNDLVEPSQLLKNPQYQSVGLTQDHLRSHGSQLEQRVPVLVLRIPSSYLKNPSAELYANLPQNYPLSQYLNRVNLQEMVNQYFKKIGYSHAPQVMTYHNSLLSTPETHSPPQQVPQQYASPYVQPTYTHADYSGVQYSAVQPVMARYPSGYQQQYYVTRGQSLYRQPLQQQQYVYRYRYVPQSAVQSQSYYVQPTAQPQPQYQHGAYQLPSQGHQEQVVLEHQAHDAGSVEYGTPQSANDEEHPSAEYTIQQTPAPQYEPEVSVTPNYESVDTATSHHELMQIANQESAEHGPTQVRIPFVASPQYQYPHSESIAVYSRGQTGHRYNAPHQSAAQNYGYQSHHHETDHGLVLTENYPSKDHTIATVLPLSYKNRNPHPQPVQAVSYVTPLPHSMKYHSQFRVMVPQTVFRTPTSEKVTYVNSHSIPSYSHGHGSLNSEAEYTVGSHYIPPIGRQKAPAYPRNYHSHPKRMLRTDHKSDTGAAMKAKKHVERNDKKS